MIGKLLVSIPFFFAISAIIDYSTTVWFAGTKENLIQNEFSPLLVYAVRNDLLIPYLILTVIFYYSGSYIALKMLSSDEKLFYPASAIIILISLAHTFGGFSWYFKSETYSNIILAISAMAIMMAIFLSGWSILQKRNVS
jgi:ABC-type multidrug transport system permease subunit